MAASAPARSNRIQRAKLIEALQREPDIARATYKRCINNEEFWIELAKQLNSFGPPVKHHSYWKRVWFDLKCAVKRKMRQGKKPLSELERKVTDMIASPPAADSPTEKFDIPVVLCGDGTPRDIKIEMDDSNDMLNLEEPTITSRNDFPIRRNKATLIKQVLQQNRELLDVMRLSLESQKQLMASIQQATKANEQVAGEMQKNNSLLAKLIHRLSQDTDMK